jgi:hypothetical protein
MYVKNKEYLVLSMVNDYLYSSDDERGKELHQFLSIICENLESRKSARNEWNTKTINERRKIDKNYGRSKKQKLNVIG